MRLKEIKIVNFQSFVGEHSVRLDSRVPLTLVLGSNLDNPEKADSNGAGKTTILNAICWTLYGATPSGASKDKLIHHGCDDVRCELQASGIHIVRTKKRNKSESLKFRIDGQDPVYGDLADTQRRLEEYLGIDFSTFCNTVYLGQTSKTVDFVRSTPAERARILANLVDDAPFQAAAKLVGEDISKAESSLLREEGQAKILLKLENQLLEKKHQIEKKLQQAAIAHQEKRNQAIREMTEIKQQIDDLKLAFSVESPVKLKDLTHEKTVYQKKLDQIVRNVGARGATLGTISQLGDKMGGDASSDKIDCPSCLRPIDEDCWIHLEEVREKTLEEFSRLERAEILVRKKIESLQKEIDEVIEIDKRKTHAENQIAQLTREFRLLKDTLQSVSVSHYRQQLAENSSEIADLAVQQSELQHHVVAKKQEIQQLKVIKRMFQQELRNVLFDRVRTSLDYYTKMYLYQLIGNGVEVLYPPVSKTGAEKFEIILKVGGHEQDISSFSTGESWRVTFAILLALRRTLLGGNSAEFKFLMVDDPIGALDETGAREFIRLLGRLGEQGEAQIFATLPRTTDYGHLQYNRIRVQKRNRCSTILQEEAR